MIESRLGELAALGTAICWTTTSIFFELAGRKIGSLRTLHGWLRHSW